MLVNRYPQKWQTPFRWDHGPFKNSDCGCAMNFSKKFSVDCLEKLVRFQPKNVLLFKNSPFESESFLIVMGCCCQCSDRDECKPYEYDPSFDGCEKKRKCTDILCCLIFFLFFCGMLAILFVTLPNSNYKYMYIPTDHRGLLCGYDNRKLKVTDADDLPNLEKKPYLFWVRPGKPGYSRSFCVESCPTIGYFSDAFSKMANSTENGYQGFPETEECGTFNKPDNTEVKVYATVENYSESATDTSRYENRFFCPYATEKVIDRCFPVTAAFQNIIDGAEETITDLMENVTLAVDAVSTVSRAIQDVYDLIWPIAACVGGALVISLIWQLLLRFLACVMVWLSILLAGAGLAFLTYMCWLQWHNEFGNHQTIENYTFGFISTDLNKSVFKVLFWIMIVIDAIFVLLVIFLFTRIILSIKLIGLVSKMFARIPSLFFFPVFIYILMFIWWVYVVGVACVLFGAGTPTRKFVSYTEDDPNAVVDYIDMEYNKIIQGMAIYHAVGWIWITCFLSALGEMTVAGVVAQWFFTRKEDRRKWRCCSFMVTKSFFRCLRYHIGTLALGSFIITVCKVVRAFIEYIDQKTRNSQNTLARCCFKCMKCCLWCLEKFLKFLNRNVYILTAIHGYSFCPGCCKAFNLILRNCVRVATLNSVSSFTFFMGKLFISAGMTAVAIYVFPMVKPDIQFIVVPAVIVFVCSWLAAGVFMGVFDMAIDAMFICFLEDEERNDGSPGHEKYAPKGLRKFIDKHGADGSKPRKADDKDSDEPSP